MATIVTSGWDATHLAVHRENLIGQNGDSELSLLRHPSYPLLAEIPDDLSVLFDELRSVAEDYLLRVALLVDPVLKEALRLLKAREPRGFGWLPVTWDGPAGRVDPRGSFVVERSRAGTTLDQTVVLMAGNRSLKDDTILMVDGLAIGLRVVMHIGPRTSGMPIPIRVTGCSMCELRRAVDPKSLVPKREERFAHFFGFALQLLRFQAMNLSGYEELTPRLLRFAGVGTRTSSFDDMTGFLWNVELGLTEKQDAVEFVSIREQEQLTYAQAPGATHQPKLFFRDPASCGFACDVIERSPTRATIDRFREDAPFLPPKLEEAGRFKVLQSDIADPQNQRMDVQSVDPANLPVRSDHLAAAQTYLRAREFFACLSDVDLSADAYFKFAQLPLLMRHRAAFRAHPDGKSVRAQVRLEGAPVPFGAKYDATTRPQLEVAFGSAALRHRAEHPNDHGRSTLQPLGLAADPRWAWHEFGHVLSYAATGALEFEFAHSVGDSLAAVLNDATSCLADDPLYDGVTYPWVPAGRRHDRDAAAGWCWCGRRNGQRRAVPAYPPKLYKGYVEEQMLSSSVFRFYRAIGGHPKNAPAMRERAATATAYLLLRAASLLGPAALVPARSADAMVSAMVDADIGTQQPGALLFTGGCLHKVLRWAFERQGLFATPLHDKNVEGPGLPPAVDLWVKDRRRDADKGGYEPVALEWPEAGPKPEEPAWFADPEEGVQVDNRNIHVKVRNRGEQAAIDVTVRAWSAPVSLGTLHWHLGGEVKLAQVQGGDCVSAHIAAGPSGGQKYLLVDVSASGDRSNLDGSTHLPCAGGTAPPSDTAALRDLVANDNNLALRLIP